MRLYRNAIATLAPFALCFAVTAVAVAAPGGQANQPAGGAAAQERAAGAAQSTAQGPAQGARAGANAFTTANVTASDPFGQIDVAKAGNTEQSVAAWARGLSAAQREEMQGRCNVIMSGSNESHYSAQAVSLCRNFAAAEGQSSPTPR